MEGNRSQNGIQYLSANKMLILQQHESQKYPPRTYFNAGQADITIAFASDFSTAGEALTRKAAGAKYLPISLSTDPVIAARAIYRELRARNATVINIAGNGIYTLTGHGWTQESLNAHLHSILSLVFRHWKVAKLVSGGQTGVDVAGLVVGAALGITAVGTLPKGFLQRGANNRDVERDPKELESEIRAWAAKLNSAN